MPINAEGLLDGLTSAGIVLSATIIGLFTLYKAIKLKAKLLAFAALTMFFVGLLWLGPFVDLIFLLIREENVGYPPPYEIYAILSYMWVAPTLVFALYLGGELIWPKGKWILVVIYVALGLVFEMFLWFNTNHSFEELWPKKPGETIIAASFETTHPTFILVAVFLVSALIFLGIGFLIKAKQATGDLRRKFLFLAIGFIIFVFTGASDSLIEPGPLLGIIRGVMMTFAIWLYL
ncbi:MAG: hypothetical protein ACFFG0_21090, partial [Candidatus Thorarchaeota archaeon]